MVPSKRLSLVAAGVAALVVGADLANFRVAADAEKPSVGKRFGMTTAILMLASL